jgi:hypothetical protein
MMMKQSKSRSKFAKMSREDKMAFIEARKAKIAKNRSKAKVMMSKNKLEKMEKGEESNDIEDLIFESQNL